MPFALGLILACLLAATPFAPAAQASLNDENADQLLAKIGAAYKPYHGFRGRYSAFSTPGLLSGSEAKKKTGRGIVLFARPDKFRLIQEKPTQEEFIISPAGVWWYRLDLAEAHRYPASEFMEELGPFFKPLLQLFSGQAEAMKKNFTITRHVGGDEGKGKALRFKPHSHESGLNWMEFLIQPDGLIRRVNIHTLAGDLTSYTFTDVDLTEDEPEEGFGFIPPTGTKIVHH